MNKHIIYIVLVAALFLTAASPNVVADCCAAIADMEAAIEQLITNDQADNDQSVSNECNTNLSVSPTGLITVTDPCGSETAQITFPTAATILPCTQLALIESDNNISEGGFLRTGNIGTSDRYARCDHQHPIIRIPNPGDPTVTLSGPATLGSNQVIRRWSTEESYSYGYRANVTTTVDDGWAFLTIPAKAGFQIPKIEGISSYRYSGEYDNQPASPAGGDVGSMPNAPVMIQEVNHYIFTQRIYIGRINDKETLARWWINYNLEYIYN